MELMVCPVPVALREEQLQYATAVVIDALRMTSVAIEAFANGCAAMRPTAEVDQARALAAEHGALLGGERNALRIEGFDFSNSPLEYARERVQGHRLVVTTSNGTRALLAAQGAERVLLGGLINAGAVAQTLLDAERVCFVLAGTHGAFSLEDALAAGAVIERLVQGPCPQARCDDMALASLRLYSLARPDLHGALSVTRHYGVLRDLGFEADLRFCLREDSHWAVPQLCEDGWIRLMEVED